jgi:hypothetical protein
MIFKVYLDEKLQSPCVLGVVVSLVSYNVPEYM